jgi:type I restriction enzyme M protein
MARAWKTTAPQTTAQRLDSIVKFLDDLERMHADEAELAGSDFDHAIEPPYRWRDWAADNDGITGPDLLTFITAEKTILPNGAEGPGLFAYLRSLRGTNGVRDRRDVISTVFRSVINRMESGYLLRDVINLINGIHFDSSEEMHTLGRLYETLLREMRDAAGDSGEFYTPRAVVRFMVERIDPRIGETVLDPACSTGGFLTEAFAHMALQADTVEKQKQLQSGTLMGVEPKSLPFLLVQMNLLLHGLESPEIDPGNALRFRLSEIGERERVNVILTNPPFGGEEEVGILSNFPGDRHTTETALLFLQLIMRRLKRKGTRPRRRGRAAWNAVRHWRRRPDQGGLAGEVQPSYDGLPARKRLRALYRYRSQHPVLRHRWPDRAVCLLGTACPRRQAKIFKDRTAAICRPSGSERMVGLARR